MIDYHAYHVASKLRDLLGMMLAKKVPTIPTAMILELNALDGIFAKDVAAIEKQVDDDFKPGMKSIDLGFFLPVPVSFHTDAGPDALIAPKMTRRISLPPRDAPYYRAVLHVEAESAVREYCELAILQVGLNDGR